MKKVLLTVISVLTLGAFAQQTPSPQWNTMQNTNFPIPAAGVRYMDAISNQVVWATGYDGFAVNANYCWVSRTINGGSSWNCSPVWQSTTNPSVGDTSYYVIASIFGRSATEAWVAAYTKDNGGSKGGIFRTTNGGASWTNMTAAGMYTNNASFCNFVFFFDANVGITAGDPHPGNANEHEIWRTTDGGNTWSLVPGSNIPNPVGTEYTYTDVFEVVGPTHAWMGTNTGRMFYTKDAGVTWSVTTIKAGWNCSDVAFVDQNHGLALLRSGTNIELYYTSDGGATWTMKNGGTDPNFGRNDICAIPGTSWFASCGAGTGNQLLSFSMDNGDSWNNWGSVNIQYLEMDFVDHQTAWAGSFSDLSNPTIGGIWKYTGPSLLQAPNASFTISPVACASIAVTPGNNSTGNPTPTYTWSTNPPTSVINMSTSATPTIFFSSPGIYTVTLMASNTSSTSMASATINVQACTGINELSAGGISFGMFPNPAKESVYITLPSSNKPYTISLTNILGSVLIHEKNISPGTTHILNVKDYQPGIYFVTITEGNTKSTQKLVIE